jgi:Na+/H+-dicarboxylate symporter
MTVLLKRIESINYRFGTTSSEAVFPKLTEELERFGVKDKIVSFMLPLGYSFNLDGSMMYMTFASFYCSSLRNRVRLRNANDNVISIDVNQCIAGVPRASLVVVAATCVGCLISEE